MTPAERTEIALATRIERLEADLLKYGHHLAACPRADNFREACNCGFSDAIENAMFPETKALDAAGADAMADLAAARAAITRLENVVTAIRTSKRHGYAISKAVQDALAALAATKP